MTRIETLEDVAEGVAWLAARDPGMARIAQTLPLPPLRRRPPGYAALLQIITGQQVSTASAAAIWARLEDAGLTEPNEVLKGGEEALRSCGLSRPKIRYALAIAERAPDFAALARQPGEEVIAALIALPGIGRWSAEIYALSALGHGDVLPAGDLALQEATRLLYGLDARPGEADLRARGLLWSPWRSIAARQLWSWYRAETKREGLQ
ncbi:DNA-3-methyladenine glycosylase 2 family protein [Pseudooceanicola sp. CBS1P-1]|uniref:DNA-3-methyladenine glycosylase II n=1 Tax=Pseudooceanicola albus TaxID=2692189 RepID=A0A6L7GAA1_9RHOB|nr:MULTISPECIES: DNA-3-methyladenine glycosylase 2 family protein [Pseudooceanicola]MBT9384286.1 DNA-3-methyladenine glycosylase 2 family protein [Pseudooceanicola endophyticus]MXN20879.1 DNA-3-methyladenine glycosylase 2 family protein [Pseudooceanicola albus]